MDASPASHPSTGSTEVRELMDVPPPPQAVATVVGFVRDRLSEVSGTVLPLIARSAQLEVVRVTDHDRSVLDHARQLAGRITSAAAPFAPNAYARVRLIRQMHATGLLGDDEIRRSALPEDPPGGDTPGGDTPGVARPR